MTNIDYFTIDWFKKFEPNRIKLSAEQLAKFDEKVENLEVCFGNGWKEIFYNADKSDPLFLRQRAAIFEALAENIERFKK